MKRLPSLLVLVLIAALFSCGDDGTTPTPTPSAIGAQGDTELTGTAGAAVAPIQVRVLDADGVALAGIEVSFHVTAGGGSVNPANATTGSDGVAQTTWTLGPGAGTQTLEARVSGVSPLVFTATAEPGPAAMVDVDPAQATLDAVGATVQLSAVVQDARGNAVDPQPAVTWSSGDETVATVDIDGLVTATGNGTATIAATTEGASGQATVTVAQEAATIELAPDDFTLARGTTRTIQATVRDAGNAVIADAEVSWSSSAEAVATVDDGGTVTGVEVGSAVVTATSGDASATAAVEVILPASGISVGAFTRDGETLDPGSLDGLVTASGFLVAEDGFTGDVVALLDGTEVGRTAVTVSASTPPAGGSPAGGAAGVEALIDWSMDINTAEIERVDGLWQRRFPNGDFTFVFEVEDDEGATAFSSDEIAVGFANPAGVVLEWSAENSSGASASTSPESDPARNVAMGYYNGDLTGRLHFLPGTGASGDPEEADLSLTNGVSLALSVQWTSDKLSDEFTYRNDEEGTAGVEGEVTFTINSLTVGGEAVEPRLLNDDRTLHPTTPHSSLNLDNGGPSFDGMAMVSGDLWVNQTDGSTVDDQLADNGFVFRGSNPTLFDAGIGFTAGSCRYRLTDVNTSETIEVDALTDLSETGALVYLLELGCWDAFLNFSYFPVHKSASDRALLGTDYTLPTFTLQFGGDFTVQGAVNPDDWNIGLNASDEGSGLLGFYGQVIRNAPGLTDMEKCVIGDFSDGECHPTLVADGDALMYQTPSFSGFQTGAYSGRFQAVDHAWNVSSPIDEAPESRVVVDVVAPTLEGLRAFVTQPGDGVSFRFNREGTALDDLGLTEVQGFVEFEDHPGVGAGFVTLQIGTPFGGVFNSSYDLAASTDLFPTGLGVTDPSTGVPTEVLHRIDYYRFHGRDAAGNLVDERVLIEDVPETSTSSFKESGVEMWVVDDYTMKICNNEEGEGCDGAPTMGTLRMKGLFSTSDMPLTMGQPVIGVPALGRPDILVGTPVGTPSSSFSGFFNGSYYEYILAMTFSGPALGLNPGTYTFGGVGYDEDLNGLVSHYGPIGEDIQIEIVGKLRF